MTGKSDSPTRNSDSPSRFPIQDPLDSDKGTKGKRIQVLVILALVLAGIYGVIGWLSFRFENEIPDADHPIIAVLLLFGLAFVIYLIAISIASKSKQNSRLVWMIIGTSLIFRLIMFFSVPILEVDIYRYLWDGIVTSQGVSPFRFPPDQVSSNSAQNSENPDLRKLAGIVRQNPEIANVLHRVHFGDLPTVYPPTSQAVFCGAAMLTPEKSSLTTRLQMMKLCLLTFDVGVLLLVVKLLSICKLPIGLSIMYGWCPLVIKEVANSGHLDTIAVFLSILIIYLLARLSLAVTSSQKSGVTGRLCLIAVILAAAVGAKLYPIVLGPLVFLYALKRFGLRSVVFPSLVFVVVMILVMWPMLPRSNDAEIFASGSNSSVLQNVLQNTDAAVDAPNDPSVGLKTFFKYWEMNDFIFLIVVENLKPAEYFPANGQVWFSILPDQPRKQLVEFVSKAFSIPILEAPFLVTRAMTSLVFVIVAGWLAWRASQRSNVIDLCQSAFLTLAWFWLLSPTQNPWYWLWALPLLPFVRNRAWIVISGLVMVYYLRFWLDYHYSDSSVLNTVYQGTDFFDFVVTWLEFGPWLISLAAAGFWIRFRDSQNARGVELSPSKHSRH